MSFDLFALEQQILDRLEPLKGEIPLAGTFGQIDVTDSSAFAVAANVVFGSFAPVSQVGASALHHVAWTFDLYVDVGRATPAQKTAAAALFSNALQSLIGWEFSRGREVRTAEGQPSGYDGRVLRISFGFIIPVLLAG